MVAKDPKRDLEQDAGGDEEGFDFERLKETLGFVLKAPRRRPVLAASVFVVVVALGLALAKTLPATYNANTKLLAQRNSVLHALANSSRELTEADKPTQNVADLIMSHDNLVALVKEANLVERFYAKRPLALRLKDQLFALTGNPMSQEDKERALLGTLSKRLYVGTDDASVTINVDWSDPKIAYELVMLVQKKFLEARYDSEVAAVTDTIAVLEEHAKNELAEVDRALEGYQHEYERVIAGRSPSQVVGHTVVVNTPVGPVRRRISLVDPELTKALEEKRRQIRALEDERQHELDNLKQQLTQAQLTMTPMHPTVISLQQKIAEMRQPTAELTQMKSEERALMGQIVSSTPDVESGPATAAPAPAPVAANGSAAAALPLPLASSDAPHPFSAPDTRAFGAPPAPSASAEIFGGPVAGSSPTEDGPTQLARSKLEAAIHRYQDAMASIDAAKVELDITRTAFKNRYTVVIPAEIPNRPKRPLATLIGVGSVLGGALLAVLAAAASVAAAGRVLESWEIRRRLKLDVLGEFDLPV